MKYVYKIKLGDSIAKIAKDFDMSEYEILTGNNITAVDIHPGLLILLQKHQGVRRVVRPYESIESIAKSEGIPSQSIRDYNHIERVFMGQVIYLPR